MTDCFTPLSTVFQSYHSDSSHYSCHSWVSPVLGWGSAVFYPRTLPRNTQRIRCGSNPGPLDYESKTLPLSHAGPLVTKWLSKNLQNFDSNMPVQISPDAIRLHKIFKIFTGSAPSLALPLWHSTNTYSAGFNITDILAMSL